MDIYIYILGDTDTQALRVAHWTCRSPVQEAECAAVTRLEESECAPGPSVMALFAVRPAALIVSCCAVTRPRARLETFFATCLDCGSHLIIVAKDADGGELGRSALNKLRRPLLARPEERHRTLRKCVSLAASLGGGHTPLNKVWGLDPYSDTQLARSREVERVERWQTASDWSEPSLDLRELVQLATERRLQGKSDERVHDPASDGTDSGDDTMPKPDAQVSFAEQRNRSTLAKLVQAGEARAQSPNTQQHPTKKQRSVRHIKKTFFKDTRGGFDTNRVESLLLLLLLLLSLSRERERVYRYESVLWKS